MPWGRSSRRSLMSWTGQIEMPDDWHRLRRRATIPRICCGWVGYCLLVGGNWRVRHEQAVEMDGTRCETAGNGVNSCPPPVLENAGSRAGIRRSPSTFHCAQ